jgi:hypothetical protein
MSDRVSPNLLEEIDRLVTEYFTAAGSVEGQTIHSDDINVEEILKHGAFPPSDPRSASAAELLEIAVKLTAKGGNTRLTDVLDAYRTLHGRERAATLNARWQYLAEQ